MKDARGRLNQPSSIGKVGPSTIIIIVNIYWWWKIKALARWPWKRGFPLWGSHIKKKLYFYLIRPVSDYQGKLNWLNRRKTLLFCRLETIMCTTTNTTKYYAYVYTMCFYIINKTCFGEVTRLQDKGCFINTQCLYCVYLNTRKVLKSKKKVKWLSEKPMWDQKKVFGTKIKNRGQGQFCKIKVCSAFFKSKLRLNNIYNVCYNVT